MSRRKTIFLTIVLFLATLATRFLFLSDYPQHLTQDEAAIGYNAYSILKTGHDEWGEFMPLHFKSVGDYKPPFDIYLTSLSIAVFGLNEFAVRFPVALFSALSVIPLYFIFKQFIITKHHQTYAWVAAFLLSFSHWHIFFSRSGYEAVTALAFLLANIYFLFKFTRSPNHLNLLAAAIFALLSIATYHSTRLFTPLFQIIFLIIYWDKFLDFFKKNSKNIFHWKNLLTMASLLLLFLISSQFLLGKAASRAHSTFLANDFEFQHALLDLLPAQKINFLNKHFLLLNFWFFRYLQYFSPSFYLTDSDLFALPDRLEPGVLSLVEFPLLALGLLVLIHRKKPDFLQDGFQTVSVLFSWLLLAFLPASLANNAKHALRSLNALPVILFLISIGLIFLLNKLKTKPKIIALLIGTLLSLFALSRLRVLDYYLIHYPVQLSEYRHYGWEQVAKFAITQTDNYQQIVVDPRFGIQGQNIVARPHYYFLFYSKFDPLKYNTSPRRLVGNSDFKNFKFRSINWQAEDKNNKLFIGSPMSFELKKIPQEAIVFKVYNPNNTLAFIAVDGNFE